MAKPKIKLDSRGLGAVLGGSEVTGVINDLGDDVAGRIHETAHDGPVDVDVTPYRAKVRGGPPRAAVSVTMTHPGAIAIEAKRGSLVRAAGAAGLQVKRRS